MRFGEQQLHVPFPHNVQNFVFGVSVQCFLLSKLNSLNPFELPLRQMLCPTDHFSCLSSVLHSTVLLSEGLSGAVCSRGGCSKVLLQ